LRGELASETAVEIAEGNNHPEVAKIIREAQERQTAALGETPGLYVEVNGTMNYQTYWLMTIDGRVQQFDDAALEKNGLKGFYSVKGKKVDCRLDGGLHYDFKITRDGLTGETMTLKRLRDEDVWSGTKAELTKLGTNYEACAQPLQIYLSQFPKGAHADEAAKLIKTGLPEKITDRDWQALLRAVDDSGNDYESVLKQVKAFIEHYPDSKYAENASELLTNTLPEKIERQAWKNTASEAAAASTNYEFAAKVYQNYLKRFPTGNHAKSASEILDTTLPSMMRDRDYNLAVTRASEQFASKKWSSAEVAITSALRLNPEGVASPKLQEMQKQVVAELEKQAAQQREQRYQKAIATARTALASQDSATASEQIAIALEVHPEDAVVTELKQQSTIQAKAQIALNNARLNKDGGRWSEALNAVDEAIRLSPKLTGAVELKSEIEKGAAAAKVASEEARRTTIKSLPLLSIDDLMQACWNQNESLTRATFAEKGYAGKKIRYVGTVDTLRPEKMIVEFTSQKFIKSMVGNNTEVNTLRPSYVNVQFAADKLDQLKSLTKGSQVEIVGELYSLELSDHGFAQISGGCVIRVRNGELAPAN
jgi:tetratricopeptide (TPR) repeat protein